jgi:hypothetical protein
MYYLFRCSLLLIVQDAILAVTCVQGSPPQIERVLQQMKQMNLKPNEISFNTLLDRFASDGSIAEVFLSTSFHDWLDSLQRLLSSPENS